MKSVFYISQIYTCCLLYPWPFQPKVLNISDTESLSDGEGEIQSMQNIGGLGFGMSSEVEVAESRHLGVM